MDIRDMLTKLTLLEGSGITPGAAGAGFKATGSQGVKPTGDLKHGMPMRLNTASPTGRAPTARLPEADVEEGNRFTDKLMKARAAGKTQADLDGDGDMEPVKEAKKAKPDFLDVDNDKNRKESFKKAVADRARGKKAVKENLRLVKETALGDRSLRVYHDREYREYHVCVLEGDAVVSRQFAGSTAEATALVRNIVSEARGMKVAWPGSAEYKEKFGQDRETFRKKHAPSVMKSPAGRKELAQLDTEYEAGKKSYGRDEEGDDDEGDKKALPTGEKRGRGRPKGSKRAIGAKGPSGRSKLLTREQQLDEISSDLALTAARRAEKKGQAYADDNLSSGPAIGYEYMQQAKRLQRGADKRRERERDQEVQAALSPAKRRRMTKEEQLDEISVGDRVTIDFPGSQAHGKSGRVVSIRDGMAKVAVGGATGTQTKMQWDSGAFGPRGMEVDLGRGQRGGGTHTEVPLDAVKRRGQGISEVAKWRDPDREGQTWARDDASGPNDPRPGKIPLTKTGQRDANTWADRGSGTASDPLAWKAAQKKAAGTLTPDDVKFGVKKNFPRYEEQDVSEDYDQEQLDEISSDLALTAARRAEKIGQAYADDNLSSGPQIGYEYMQQAKRLQRGADKRRERERDQEVQAALSPAKRRRMETEDYDQDEYDEEGEMAQSQSRTIADAAAELESMLDADENLPEWVQKKISLAQEYIDSARDYLAANRPEDSDEEMPLPEGNTGDYSAKKARAGKDMDESALQAYLGKKKYGKEGMSALQKAGREGASKERMAKIRARHDKLDEEPVNEKMASKAQNRLMRATAGGADTGVSPKVAREFIKKSHGQRVGDLPERVREGDIDVNRHPQTRDYGRGEDEPKADEPKAKKPAGPKKPTKPTKQANSEEKVSETTTSGSVATAPAAGGKKSKGGIQYGKGVYEAKLAESFDAELDRVVSEGTTITINSPDSGEASVSINGTGDDAMALANLLKMAGLFSGGGSGYQSACSSCGQMHEGSCGMVEEDLANSADNTETMSTDYMVNGLSGGLNGPKLQVNPNNAGDNPLAMKDLGQKSSPAVNLGAIAEQVEREAENRLLDLYRKIS